MTCLTHRRLQFLLILPGLLLAGAGPATAQTLTLSLSPSTISFPSADPDTAPTIAASPVTVTYGVRDSNANDTWTLTVQALGDLTSGSATIPIGNISWTASPQPPFQDGVLSWTMARTLASGNTDIRPARTGTVVFSLSNLWTYTTGTY
jgi:hypothetical protein